MNIFHGREKTILPISLLIYYANDNGKHHVDIFDSKGLLVKSIDYSGSSIEIDLSSLPNGTYYIHLTYNGMQGVRTIVKH